MAVGLGTPTCSPQLAGKWFQVSMLLLEQGLYPREKPAGRHTFQEELQDQCFLLLS